MNKRFFMAVMALGFAATAFAQKMGEPVLVKAGDKCIDLQPSYAAPSIVDYDNDGKQDLVVGTFDGKFRFYKNIGSKSKPLYGDFKLIQANGKEAVAKNW